MSRQCQLTGGHRAAVPRPALELNPRTRRDWLPSEDRYLRPRLSAKAIKAVDRRGIEAVLARLRARGERI